jgi:MFS family permease
MIHYMQSLPDSRQNIILAIIAGFGLFTISLLFCCLSGSINELIFFRVLHRAAAGQSIRAAMIALYLLENKRGWGFGILMTLVSLRIIGGPVLGGYITEFLWWHWTFFIIIPVGIIGVCLALRCLPGDFKQRKIQPLIQLEQF